MYERVMRYLSVCSGIEAASVAWPMWEAVGFSEIEPFPSAVLRHHYPGVPNLGDMTRYREWDLGSIDLLVGGTPCQSFSVAGLRKGLDDPRGNLMLVYCGILERFRPKWFVWENVPGVLSSNGGRDFGSFLGAVAELGYGWAYRVLDAQWFGVAQRRRRVFVVGCLGDWESAAKVLFERESLSGNPAPRREAGQAVAGGVEIGPGGGRFTEVNPTLDTRAKDGPVRNQLAGAVLQPYEIGNTLTARMHKGMNSDCNEGQTPVLSYAIQGSMIGRNDNARPQGDGINEEVCFTQNCVDRHVVAQPMVLMDQGGSVMNVNTDGTVGTLRRETHGHEPAVLHAMQVRRLTPVECERLQGFPDGYTNIPWRGKPESPDGPRYKALGNSMAVPVMKWIGERIQREEKGQVRGGEERGDGESSCTGEVESCY